MQEITVVQGLKTEVGELGVAFRVERRAESGEVVLRHTLIEQFGRNSVLDVAWEIFCITCAHLRLGDFLAEDLAANGVHQQTRGDFVVGWVALNHRAGGHGCGFENFLLRHTVVQVAQGTIEDRFGVHGITQAFASRLNQ